MKATRLFTGIALVLAAAPLLAEGDAPVVRQVGKTVVEWRSPLLKTVVGYKWANANFDKSRWIFFEAAFLATGGKPVGVDREDVSLVMPDGTTLNLPSQKRLAEGVPDLRFLLKKAEVARDPLTGYFPSALHEQRIPFFTVPGEDIVMDEFSVNHTLLARGDLFFEAPGQTFPPGLYTLKVANKEVDVKIPIRFPAAPLEKSRTKDDKTVPW